MANINLSSEGAKEKLSIDMGNGGLVVLIIIMFIIIALYGGELFYGKKLAKEISQLQSEYAADYGDPSKGDFLTVADFSGRLGIARSEVNDGKDIRENLGEIEKLMIPGVYLSSYKYNDKGNSIVLECIGDNYNLAAKQILNFKKSTWFSEVFGGETSFDSQSGKIEFKVNLKLK